MKSALPKVLHQACGLPLIEHVLRAADPLAPASTVVVVGHEAELVANACRRTAGAVASGAGAAARDRARAAAGGAGAGWPARHAWSCCRVTCRCSGRRPSNGWSGRTQAHGAAATVLTASVDDPDRLRANRPPRRAPSPPSSSIATPRQRCGRSGRSTAASTPSTSSRCSTRSAPSAPPTRRASTTCPTWFGSTAPADCVVETVTLEDPTEILGVNSRRELADVAAHLRDRKNDALMAAGVTIIDPATTWIEPDVAIGAGHHPPPGRLPAGTHPDWRRAASSTPASASSTRTIDDEVFVNSFCVITRVADRRGGADRPVRAHPPAVGRRRAGARRQLRRAEEDHARPRARRPTTSPISATRPSASRSTSAPARSPATTTASPRTRRSSRMARSSAATASCRAGPHRRGRLRRGRLLDHPGRPRRRARPSPGQAGQQGRLGATKARKPRRKSTVHADRR